MTRTHQLILPLAILLASGASAQVASSLLQENGPVPGAAPGTTVSFINNTAVNGVGGYAATINVDDGVNTLSMAWGNASGGAGTVLRTESTIGVYEQTSFESFFGISDSGQVAYSPSSINTSTLVTGLDGVWLDDTILALEDEPIPALPGKEWRFASRPGVTNDGQAAWVGGINDTVSGAVEGNGLFLSGNCLHKTGDSVPNLPSVLGATGIDFDYRFSAKATHYILRVDTDNTSTNDEFVVLDGSGLMFNGILVGEAEVIDASVPGALAGERWDNFDYFGIAEDGQYMFTGDTDAATDQDEFIFKNGAFLYREGDVIDGEVLTGSIEGAYMNEAGDIAYIWDVEDAVAGDLEAVFADDKFLLKEGDAVDFDGDGVIDPGATVSGFTGLSALTMGPNRMLYFTADVDTLGTSSTSDDTECLFALEVPTLSVDVATLSLGTGGTATFELCGGFANAGFIYLVLGSATGTTPGFVIDGQNLPLVVDGYFLETLASPNSPTHIGTLGVLSPEGQGSAQLIVPAGTNPAFAGVTLYHAYLTFDAVNLFVPFASNAVPITMAL